MMMEWDLVSQHNLLYLRLLCIVENFVPVKNYSVESTFHPFRQDKPRQGATTDWANCGNVILMAWKMML
jgi:hypothetical protein